jgi:hypothetical protein
VPVIIFLERVVLVKISVFEESFFRPDSNGKPECEEFGRVTGTKGGGWGLGVLAEVLSECL